jgi:hypothetical protein
MATILSHFKTFGAAVLIAATLGTAGLAVTPVLAQGEPPSGFSLGMPGGNQQNQTMQSPQQGAQTHEDATGRYDPDTDDFYYCLEDHEIVRGLRDYGFERVRIVRYLRGERVEVTAYWGRSQYSMRVDRCTGQVDRVRLIRRSGFGLQFNFSN